LPDGRYNVLVVGLRRIRLKRELAPLKLYREAEVELLEDIYPASGEADRVGLQHKLIAQFRRALPTIGELQEQLEQLLSEQVPLGLLTDLVAYATKLPLETKIRLLEELDVDRRAAGLLEGLRLLGDAPAFHFPPDFSAN
jgi:Lon protease-like protein